MRQTLTNLGRVLASLGVDWRHVVRLNWYLLDASQVQLVRAVRDEVIGPALGDDPPPASTLVQVAGLFRPEFLVEVDAVVSLPDEHSVSSYYRFAFDKRLVMFWGPFVVHPSKDGVTLTDDAADCGRHSGFSSSRPHWRTSTARTSPATTAGGPRQAHGAR